VQRREVVTVIPFQALTAQDYLDRAQEREKKYDYKRAVRDYDQAIRIDPDFAPAFSERAWIWATCPKAQYRDGPRALESARKACELTEWRVAASLAALGAAYAETGDFDAAVATQEKALKLAKRDEEEEKLQRRLNVYEDHKPCREPEP